MFTDYEKFFNAWKCLYEGEEGGGGTESGSTEGGGEGGGKTEDPKPKTFTQADVDKILGSERQKHRSKIETLAGELDALKTQGTLNKAEREKYAETIEDLRNSVKTQEELKEQEKKKLQKKYDEDITTYKTEAEGWKTKYKNETIKRALVDAAVANKAFNPEHITAILGSNTKLVEKLDEDGKFTGDYDVKTVIKEKKSDGSTVDLELSPNDAVKKLSEMDGYLNLFQTNATGGFGGYNRGSSGKTGSVAANAKNLSPKEYRKQRREGGLELQ